MSAGNKLSLEELLTSQDSFRIQGTLEPVTDNAEQAKFTPWIGENKCLCEASFTILKSDILGIYDSGSTHICCGKSLKVVEVELGDTFHIPVGTFTSVLRKASASLRQLEYCGNVLYNPQYNDCCMGATGLLYVGPKGGCKH